MLDRSQLLSLAMAVTIMGVGVKTYQVWTEKPREIMGAGLDVAKASAAVRVQADTRYEPRPPQPVSTKTIVERNLFDPERGMGKNKADEAVVMATQKIRSMLLVGTVILGESRYAILEDPGDPRLRSPRPELQPTQRGEMRRLKLGDTIEGFKLVDVKDRSVTFVNGASKVELALDYFRKFQDGRPGGLSAAPPSSTPDVQGPAAPLAPRFPRRDARQG